MLNWRLGKGRQLDDHVCVFIQISLKFDPRGTVTPLRFSWSRIGNRPLIEPMPHNQCQEMGLYGLHQLCRWKARVRFNIKSFQE